MSLQPRPWPEPAEEIATAVRKMYAGRRAPLPVLIRDESGEVFADERFAEAFADRGTPGWSPGRLALVTALQMVENLTDRQAAEAVRDKISWKYALGLELTDTGFDFSVLFDDTYTWPGLPRPRGLRGGRLRHGPRRRSRPPDLEPHTH